MSAPSYEQTVDVETPELVVLTYSIAGIGSRAMAAITDLLLVAATFVAADFIILETVLSYFGQGVYEYAAPSWGNLLAGAQNLVWYVGNLNPFQEVRGYLIFLPTLMILASVLSINYIGDALRDVLDPHGRAEA